MTIETLLAPVTTEQPCGENLEYDADFQAMEQASLAKPSSSLAAPLFRLNRLTGRA